MVKALFGSFFSLQSLKTFANANGLQFQSPNNKSLTNKQLGSLITDATIYLECFMTVAKIKSILKKNGLSSKGKKAELVKRLNYFNKARI